MQLIEYTEDQAQARSFADEALSLMQKYEIPANPINFMIWYLYLSHRYPELNSELDETLQERGTCPPSKSRELFQTYLADSSLELANRAQGEVLALVGDLLQKASDASNTAEDYKEVLSRSLDQLQTNIRPAQLKELLGPLMAHTRKASEMNLNFQASLEQAQAEIQQLREEIVQSRRDAQTDPLTKLYNRRALTEELDDCTSYFSEERPICLMVLDIDHFKRINDSHGHAMGDQVLAQTAKVMLRCVGDDAYVARYGGEEFVIVLRDCSLKKANRLAEELRSAIGRMKIRHRSSGKIMGRITISIGLTQLAPDDVPESFFDRADSALYEAKSGGRNQVVALID